MVAPPWKFVGGKADVGAQNADLFPSAVEVRARGGVYREPFAGGGAIALTMYAGAVPIVMSDTNAYLIRAYRALRDHVGEVIAKLSTIVPQYGPDFYYALRSRVNEGRIESDVDACVAVLVILMWGYNGLWRENLQGEINVPFGKPSNSGKPPTLFEADHLRAVARALAGATLNIHDFERACAKAKAGDFVYFDPPYAAVSKTSKFAHYQKGGWTMEDLARLAETCRQLDARGVQWALSNSDTPETRAMFEAWPIRLITAARRLNSRTDKRGPVGEIFVRSSRWS